MNTQNEVDELTSYNEGLVDGRAIGMKSPWIKFDKNDRSTWPELGVYVVGLWQYLDGWHGAEVFALDEDDIGGISMMPAFGRMENRTAPAYWCPLPDPMDHP
jgi:hypothetical protein